MKLVHGIGVFVFASSGLMAQVATPVGQVATTGIVALAQEQRAQFNVLNPGTLAPITQSPCTATLTFFGGDGGLLKTKTVTVAAGQTANIVLDALSDLQLGVNQRKEIRAVYMIPAVPVPVTASTFTTTTTSSAQVIPIPCSLVATLEIIDVLSDQTHLVLGGVHTVPGSAPLN